MRICENGIYRDMTEAEAAAVQAAAARAAAAERHRPLTVGEVQKMLIRAQINTLAADDATAYRMREFYPAYEVGHAYKTGDRFMHDGGLWRVLTAHTSQEAWVPGVGTESLYVRIDETHDGTWYDPIPYSGNMALSAGSYYTQDGVTYLCDRDTGAPVYNTLAELVGIYVSAV